MLKIQRSLQDFSRNTNFFNKTTGSRLNLAKRRKSTRTTHLPIYIHIYPVGESKKKHVKKWFAHPMIFLDARQNVLFP